MAPGDAAVVRSLFEAINSEDLDRAVGLTDPELEVHVMPGVSAEPDVYRGHAGMRRYFDSFHEAMEEIRFWADDILDAGDALIVAMRITAKGRHTGIAVEQRLAAVWRVRNGVALGVRTYPELAEARRAAGLVA